MKDEHFRLLDMPEAKEELVVLFPRTCLSKKEPYTRVLVILNDEESTRVRVVEGHDATTGLIVYYEFDPRFALKRAFLSSAYRQQHEQLEKAGALFHAAEADESGLPRGLEIRRKTP